MSHSGVSSAETTSYISSNQLVRRRGLFNEFANTSWLLVLTFFKDGFFALFDPNPYGCARSGFAIVCLLTSSFSLKSPLKHNSRASICHPELYFPPGAVGVRKNECAIPARISPNSTPMLGEDRFFDEILKHDLVLRF